jgi:hypothetical protein
LCFKGIAVGGWIVVLGAAAMVGCWREATEKVRRDNKKILEGMGQQHQNLQTNRSLVGTGLILPELTETSSLMQ